MGNYKRKVTYFYQYHNGNVGATAGFLKLEIRGDNVKITINIQESSSNNRENPVLYFYHEAGEKLSAVKICEVDRQGGVLTMQTRTPWREVFDTGRDLYTFDGVLVLYSDNDYYLGDFDDRDRSSYDLIFNENMKSRMKDLKEEKTEREMSESVKPESERLGRVMSESVKPESERSERETAESAKFENEKIEDKRGKLEEGITVKENTDNENKTEYTDMAVNRDSKDTDMESKYREETLKRESEKNPFEQMLNEYPKLPMYNAEELFDCVRINPRDIGRLDIGNWKLGSNSFLTHGYYTYQYLMLGKMIFGDGRKHAVLGVPGVYTNREKYMANMFGFDQFIPVKKNGLKTGQFGYWIVELCQER